MAEHAARAERVLFPCHNYKHAPVIKAVRELIAQGSIGQPHLVTLQTFRTTHARGTSAWRPDWRRERRYAGGGIGMDHGSHTFYLAFEWLRSHPTAVSANVFGSNGADTEDNMSCTRAPHVDGGRSQSPLHAPRRSRRHHRRRRRHRRAREAGRRSSERR